MAVNYLSKEWFEETGKALKEEFGTPSRIFTNLVEVYKDCPDGKTKWVEMKIVKGIMTEYNYGEGEAPEGKFRIIGKYEDQFKMAKGELDPEAALMKDIVEFQGNIIQGLTMIGTYKRVFQVRRGLDTVY